MATNNQALNDQQATGRRTRKRASSNVITFDVEGLRPDSLGIIGTRPGEGKSTAMDFVRKYLDTMIGPKFRTAEEQAAILAKTPAYKSQHNQPVNTEGVVVRDENDMELRSDDDEDEDDYMDTNDYDEDDDEDEICDCSECRRDRAREAREKKKAEEDANPVKQKKPRYKKAPKTGLFSKVGVEPTFYPSIDFPFAMVEGEKWTELFSEYVNHFLSYCRNDIQHSWIKNKAYNDSSNLEVPTDKEYTDEKALLKDYKALLRIMTRHGFKPSSVVQADSDGGCHINFDLTDRFKLYGKDVINVFCSNLVGFMNKYPTSVWGFLHYEDTESSDIYTYYNGDNLYGITKKGMCLNIPNDPEDFNEDDEDDSVYVEMRAFSMPRTAAEFMFHIDFCNKLLKYVWNETIKKPKDFLYPDMQESYELQKYTWKKAEPEFTKVLNLLGVSVRKARAFGKFDMLKQRIAKGKTYLS